jgi:hypothetical protein
VVNYQPRLTVTLTGTHPRSSACPALPRFYLRSWLHEALCSHLCPSYNLEDFLILRSRTESLSCFT